MLAARVLPALALATLAFPAQDLPYGSWAEKALADLGVEEPTQEGFFLKDHLERQYLHSHLGLYELFLPTRAEQASPVSEVEFEDYQRVALALLDSQAQWLEWLEPDSPAAKALKQAEKDHKSLRKWVDGWDYKDLRDLEDARNLLEVFDAKKSVREASERHRELFLRGTALGMHRLVSKPEPIVLVGQRDRMMHFCALGGWLYPDQRTSFWNPGVTTWTHCYIDEVKFLSTVFNMPKFEGDYRSSLRMDTKIANGLEQQVVQLATDAMLANYFGAQLPPSMAGGLAVNLVIDVFGECNTRVDGDLRARRTAAREVFVPGGNPHGGILPAHLADSRWRTEQGSDRFVSALKRAMQDSTRRDPASFVLENDMGARGMAVPAPFLGSDAVSITSVGEDYYGDRLEFLRSYRVCFLGWLRDAGAGKSKRSAEAFAAFLRGMAGGPEVELSDVLQTVYEMPLSSSELGDEDLEGRFLEWLEDQRGAKRPRTR